MSLRRGNWTDQQAEQLVGRILQIGVIVSALVVLAGGVVFVAQHGQNWPNTTSFTASRSRCATSWRFPARPRDGTPGASSSSALCC